MTNVIAIIINIILATLTGIYVVLTYKLVNESRNANEINRKSAEEQIRILTSPYIHCSISNINGQLNMSLTNGSSVPAYDVDVWISGYYSYNEIKDLIKESSNDRIFNEDEDESVYVIDRIVYPIFPNSQKVSAKLQFSIITDSISIFIQYRDSRAENYSYDVWFLDDSYGSRKSYQIGSIDPTGSFLAIRFDPYKDLEQYNSNK